MRRTLWIAGAVLLLGALALLPVAYTRGWFLPPLADDASDANLLAHLHARGVPVDLGERGWHGPRVTILVERGAGQKSLAIIRAADRYEGERVAREEGLVWTRATTAGPFFVCVADPPDAGYADGDLFDRVRGALE